MGVVVERDCAHLRDQRGGHATERARIAAYEGRAQSSPTPQALAMTRTQSGLTRLVHVDDVRNIDRRAVAVLAIECACGNSASDALRRDHLRAT